MVTAPSPGLKRLLPPRCRPAPPSGAPSATLLPTRRCVPVLASPCTHVDNPPSPVVRPPRPTRRPGSPSPHHLRTLVLTPVSRASLRLRRHSSVWLPFFALRCSRVPVYVSRAVPAPHSHVSAPTPADSHPRAQRRCQGCSSREMARRRTATKASMRVIASGLSAKMVHQDHCSGAASARSHPGREMRSRFIATVHPQIRVEFARQERARHEVAMVSVNIRVWKPTRRD